MTIILATGEAEIRRITVQGQPPHPKKKARPYLKNTQHTQTTGRVTQVVEYLPSKHKALIANPNTAPKR
jgi:hypothetical protein